MKFKCFFFTALLCCGLASFKSVAQNGPAREKFFTYFSEIYSELSQPPLINYFVNLNNTIKESFTTDNKFFAPALTETATRYKITEEIAADSLYHFVINKLLAEKLWVTFPDVYQTYVPAFKAYTDALCPCVTANFKSTDYIEKMMPALQKCVAGLVTDTVALNNIRLNAGDITLNEIFRKQQYFSLYMYQNCEVVKQALNQTLRQEAFTSYSSARSLEKGERAKNIINYYKNKKLDSLAMIFPSYKKFTKELNEALAVLKTPNALMSAYYLSNGDEKNAIVNFYTESAMLGDIMASFTGNTIYAPIEKIVFQKPEILSGGTISNEIKEDIAVPVKQ